MNQEINRHLESLETKLAFQEITIEELNQIIITLQADVGKLKEQLLLLSQKLTQVTNIASPSEETPPPHY